MQILLVCGGMAFSLDLLVPSLTAIPPHSSFVAVLCNTCNIQASRNGKTEIEQACCAPQKYSKTQVKAGIFVKCLRVSRKLSLNSCENVKKQKPNTIHWVAN
jgi:hypothetical protein